MRLRLIKGDISRVSASAIVTSANDALCGNDQPLYWRFTNQRNVDGAVRKIAGPGLRDACLALPEIKPVIHENEEPRDISRWAETAKKRGLSRTLRCAPGRAVATRAYGLDADWCIHAVAPDSEFGYEGHYQGNIGIRGEDVRARSVPPIERLHATYVNALKVCSQKDARTVALPALGAGVKAWRPRIAAAVSLAALSEVDYTSNFDDLAVVLGSDAAMVAFSRAFEAVLGESEDHAWDLEPGRLDGFEPASVTPELAPRAPRPNGGYAGDHWNPSDAGWR